MLRITPESQILAPQWFEVCSLLTLAGFYLIADGFVGESSYAAVNIVGPLALSVILGVGAWRLIRSDAKHLWTALFWFRLSTIVFFGVGTYLVFVIDSAGRAYLESFFWFFDEDVFKMNLVVAISVVLVLIFARVAIIAASGKFQLNSSGAARNGTNREYDLLVVALVFLVIGVTIEYTVKIPADFGWSTFEVPGSVMNLTRLKLVGIFLVTVWALQHAKSWVPVITALVTLDLFAQVLSFSKGSFLMSLLVFLLAFLWRDATVKRLILCGALVIGAFAGLQPIVTDGRAELERRYGLEPQAGFRERAEIVNAYFSGADQFPASNSGASALTRLTYVNAATLVINRYDSGHPGDWPALLPAVFVPRFLWPEKPIITDIGFDIYELGTGRRTSQSGAGVFADAYWASGWWGVIVFMSVYGLILGVLTVMSARLVRHGRWLFFPAVLMAVRIGYRTDGHYLADVAGGTVMLVATFGLLWIVDAVLKALGASLGRTGNVANLARPTLTKARYGTLGSRMARTSRLDR